MVSWSLAAPHKRMAQAFRNLVDEFRSFGVSFKSNYAAAVASEMDKLAKLQESGDLKATNRIRQAIEDAARYHHSVNWWPIFKESSKRRFRMKAVIYLGLAVGIVLFLIGFSSFMPPYSPHNLNASSENQNVYVAWATVVGVLAPIIIGGLLYEKIPYRYKTTALLIVAIITGIAIKKSHVWSPYVDSTWKTAISSFPPLHPRYRTRIASVHIAYMLQWELLLIMMACIEVYAFRLVRLCGKAITSGKEFGYGQPAEACAEVIIRLLNIGHSFTELSDCMPATSVGASDRAKRDKITERWLNGQRRYLDAEINGLIILIRGSWRKVMRQSYPPAGKLIASEAPRIELFIRHQQAKNALLSAPSELRKAITSTLVHAADSNWHLIGAEQEYADKVVAQRRTRVIRRAIIIALSITGAIAAAHFMRNYPALAITCGLFAFAEFLRLLDPDGPTLLDVAGRVANTLKQRGG